MNVLVGLEDLRLRLLNTARKHYEAHVGHAHISFRGAKL